jgi:polysaccharide biosynthesis transport protein
MQKNGFDKLPHRNGNGNSNGNKNGNGNGYYLPSIEPKMTNLEDDDNLDVKQIVKILKRRWLLVLAIALTSTAAMAAWTFTRANVYKGSFNLLIEPISDNKTESPLTMLQGSLSEEGYDTQVEVLRSTSVLNPIVDRLNAEYPNIFKVTEEDKDGFTYEDLIAISGKSPLDIKQLKKTKILQVSFTDKNRDKIQKILDRLSSSYLKYSLDDRKIQVKQGIKFVSQELPRLQGKVDSLQQELQRFRQQNNFLDPQEYSTLLSEQLIKVEEQYFQTQVKLKESQSLYNTLKGQLALEPSAALAASYLSESPRYQNLLGELQTVELELAKGSAVMTPENPDYQILQDKKQELLPLLQKEATSILGDRLAAYTQNAKNLSSPSSLRLQLSQQFINATNEVQVLGLRQFALAQAINNFNTQVKAMPSLARQYTDLQRQLGIANSSLNRFLEASQKLELESAQQTVPWQLVSPPEIEKKPISPKPVRNMAIGVLGGLLLGVGAAMLADRLDPIVHSLEELQDSLPYPILGQIPYEKNLKPLEKIEDTISSSVSMPLLQVGDRTIWSDNPSLSPVPKTRTKGKTLRYNASPFLEAFRSLNTSIRLLGSDSPINSFVISSSIPTEGKSTISSQLAQAAATMGQRVLIVDADLRRPQVHERLGLNNDRGLSDVLAMGFDLEDTIQKVHSVENLDVLTAGASPPDPTRLLSSTKMQQLMEELRSGNYYDLVIYDTPPILGFADGRILAKYTNGVILVAKIGTSDRNLLKQNIENLKVAGIPILGMIVNNVSKNDGGSHYYNRYYKDKA